MPKPNETLEQYKDAVWDFMLEHCDIQKSGALFIKFHCDHRANFERRILGRIKGYHRTDVVARQEHIDQKREEYQVQKTEKKEVYLMKKYGKRKWGKWYRFVKFLYE